MRIKPLGNMWEDKNCLPKWTKEDREKIDRCAKWEKFEIKSYWNYRLVKEYVNMWNDILINDLPSEDLEDYLEDMNECKINIFEDLMYEAFNIYPKLDKKIDIIKAYRSKIKEIIASENKWKDIEERTVKIELEQNELELVKQYAVGSKEYYMKQMPISSCKYPSLSVLALNAPIEVITIGNVTINFFDKIAGYYSYVISSISRKPEAKYFETIEDCYNTGIRELQCYSDKRIPINHEKKSQNKPNKSKASNKKQNKPQSKAEQFLNNNDPLDNDDIF